MLSGSRRGDTIIEVLFAIAVFSLVAVGTFTLMSQGSATSMRALEITKVRQQIDAQAEALRFLHNAYTAAYQPNVVYPATTPAGQWQRMSATIKSADAQPFGSETTCADTAPEGSFIINTRLAQFVEKNTMNYRKAPVSAGVEYISDTNAAIGSTDGIWIEAVRSQASADPNQSNIGFIDFHIRACWDSVGQQVPVTLGTIVRLYEPRS